MKTTQSYRAFRQCRTLFLVLFFQVIEESSPDYKRSDTSDQQSREGRTRRSTELEGRDDLFDYLLQAGDTDSDKPGTFERTSSLRRSRRRRGNLVDSLVADRERAQSPNTLDSVGPITANHQKSVASTILERRTSTRSTSPPGSPGRPRSPLISNGDARPASTGADEKNRWSTSSNETQAEDELARERQRRRMERGKRNKLDVSSMEINGSDTEMSKSPDVVTASNTSLSDKNAPLVKNTSSAHPVENKSDGDAEDTVDDVPAGALANRDRRPSLQLLRSRSHLDADALASALKTVEVEQHCQDSAPADRQGLTPSEAALERNKGRLSRRTQNSIEPSMVSDVLKRIEGVSQITNDQNDNESIKAKPDSSGSSPYDISSVKLRRGSTDKSWRNSRTDIDGVIQDIEKTGQEIQMLGSTQDLHKSTSSMEKSVPPTTPTGERVNSKSWINRRWRSSVDKQDVHAALSKIRSGKAADEQQVMEDETPPPPPPRTTSKIRSSMESLAQATSSEALHNGTGRGGYGDASPGSPIQRLMKEGNESITEKALLDHTSGRWKSNIETADVEEAFSRMNNGNIVHVSSSASDLKVVDTVPVSPSRSRRPLSVYDNVMHSTLEEIPEKSVPVRKHHSPSENSKSSSTLNEPDVSPLTKRWGRFINEKESNELNRSVSVTSIPSNSTNNTPFSDASRRWSAAIETSDATNNMLNNEPAGVASLKGDDAGYHSLDRVSRMRKSLGFNGLRAKNSETSPESVTSLYTSRLRHTAESQQLDQNVHQFQNALPESTYMRRKEKLKALSQRYDDDSWSARPGQKPSEQRIYEHEPVYSSTAVNSAVHFIPDERSYVPSEMTTVDQRNSLTDETQTPKSDSDSIPQDEGFETESMSDPSASQRTSMSSTLESELTGTPTMGRKDFLKQKEDIEEADENKSTDAYFARSLDSLVQRHDLAFSEAKPDEQDSLRSFNDKTPTMEDNNRLEVWSGAPGSDSDKDKTISNTPEEEEVWTTVTVERKFADMSPEEQQVRFTASTDLMRCLFLVSKNLCGNAPHTPNPHTEMSFESETRWPCF